MEDIEFLTTKRIPKLPEKINTQEVRYEIFSDFITTSISQNSYQITQVELNPREQEKYNTLKKSLMESINFSVAKDSKVNYLKHALDPIISELHVKLGDEEYKKISYSLYREFLGLGKIEPLLQDPFIKKIICKKQDTVFIEHQLYGSLKTNITISEEEFEETRKKLELLCEDKNVCIDNNLKIKISEQQLSLEKLTKKKNPLTLIQNKQASPEMLAFLWILIEHKKPILLTENLLQIANTFLPPDTNIVTNEKDIYPNSNTSYIFSKKQEQADYVLMKNQEYEGHGSPIITTQTIDEQNFFVFYIQNKTIYKIKEKGKEVFIKKEEKFYHSFQNSIFLTDNLKRELKLRTQLLIMLNRNNLNLKDLRKVINIYYRDRTAVLKKAGIT